MRNEACWEHIGRNKGVQVYRTLDEIADDLWEAIKHKQSGLKSTTEAR